MSELKAYKADVTIPVYGTIANTEVYLKSEADKVIAEKDKEIETQKRLRDMALASVPNVLKVMKIIQHHKYKRCLAMAKWCYDVWFLCLLDKEAKKSVLYWRWWNIWLELAEKFKDAK